MKGKLGVELTSLLLILMSVDSQKQIIEMGIFE
jgi:hypothetical protein